MACANSRLGTGTNLWVTWAKVAPEISTIHHGARKRGVSQSSMSNEQVPKALGGIRWTEHSQRIQRAQTLLLDLAAWFQEDNFGTFVHQLHHLQDRAGILIFFEMEVDHTEESFKERAEIHCYFSNPQVALIY